MPLCVVFLSLISIPGKTNILNRAWTGILRTQWLDLSAGVRKMEMNGCTACGRAASPARQACVGAVMEDTLESRPRARTSMSVWLD